MSELDCIVVFFVVDHIERVCTSPRLRCQRLLFFLFVFFLRVENMNFRVFHSGTRNYFFPHLFSVVLWPLLLSVICLGIRWNYMLR